MTRSLPHGAPLSISLPPTTLAAKVTATRPAACRRQRRHKANGSDTTTPTETPRRARQSRTTPQLRGPAEARQGGGHRQVTRQPSRTRGRAAGGNLAAAQRSSRVRILRAPEGGGSCRAAARDSKLHRRTPARAGTPRPIPHRPAANRQPVAGATTEPTHNCHVAREANRHPRSNISDHPTAAPPEKVQPCPSVTHVPERCYLCPGPYTPCPRGDAILMLHGGQNNAHERTLRSFTASTTSLR